MTETQETETREFEPNAWMAVLGPVVLFCLGWAWFEIASLALGNPEMGRWTSGWTGNACPQSPDMFCGVIPWGSLGTMLIVFGVSAPFLVHTVAWVQERFSIEWGDST